MPTKPTTGVISVGSQKDSRYLDTFYDQHRFSPKFPEGRPWHGYREFAANKGDKDGFIGGELTQGRHAEPGEDPRAAWATVWQSPWIPEFKYFEFNYLRSRISIRYDRVMGDDTAGLDKYYDAAAVIAHENNWAEVEYGAQPRHGITAIIGRPPRSPRIAQAAQAGDPWLLGFSEEPNEELAALIGLTRKGFALRSLERKPLVPAEEILDMKSKPGDLAAMIAAAVEAALQKRDAEDAAKKEVVKKRMADLRNKKGKSTTATLNRAS